MHKGRWVGHFATKGLGHRLGGGERGGSLKDDPWRAFLIRNLSLNFENKFCKQVKAQTLWSAIIDSQIETGTPYMLYKDACNSKSNQQNLGTIKCSNLCTEIVEYSAPDEVSYVIFLFFSCVPSSFSYCFEQSQASLLHSSKSFMPIHPLLFSQSRPL